MSDNQGAESQADANAQSQADTSSQADQQESISLDEAKKLRSEASGLRKRLKDAESKVQAAEDAKKPELDRVSGERDTFKAQYESAQERLRISNARSAVTEAALKVNAVSPRAVFALIREDLDYDDDGEPTNVVALLKQAQSDEPSLFRKSPGKGDGGETGGTAVTGNNAQMNDFIRAQARRNR